MDGLGPHQQLDGESDVAMEAPPMVGFDERRMHVRAYNYWASLLGDRSFPSIEDLNPGEIEDFGSHSVLIDFTSGFENPHIAFLGTALSRECGIEHGIEWVSEVPPRTLLSRLTDHYLQIIANQAPIGFEAEFTNQRGAEILYRGIMMPFSTDDDSIDFVYGVINWKEVASCALTDDIQRAIFDMGPDAAPTPDITSIWADGPSSADFAPLAEAPPRPTGVFAFTEASVDAAAAQDDGDYLSDDLCRSLADAQGAAADAITTEGRTRHALYRALGLAHGFALLAATLHDDYAVLLDEAGIKATPRSPMTALVKLVFGAHYDKTRLSEFAIAIDHAIASDLPAGTLAEWLAHYEGGLKNWVRDARAARRGPAMPKTDKLAAARHQLTIAPAVELDGIATGSDGLAVVVVRRMPDGGFATLGGLSGDDRRVGQLLRAVAAHT